MGKKSRKLRSPKYKAKASAFRETVARLRSSNVSTTDQIEPPQEENTTQTVEEIVQEIEEIFQEPEKPTTNALKQISTENNNQKKVETKKKTTTRKKTTTSATRKKTATPSTKKTTTTTRRRRTAKTKTTA